MLDSTTRIDRLSGRTLFRFTINIYDTQGALTRSDIEVLVSAVQEGVGQALDPSQPLPSLQPADAAAAAAEAIADELDEARRMQSDLPQ